MLTMNAHLITTQAVVGACHRCRAMILSGLAEGLHARVDPTPLDRAGERAAIQAGRWTYTLRRGELVYRDIDRIAGNSLRGPILGAHLCERTRAN